jgi:hypothetical protein
MDLKMRRCLKSKIIHVPITEAAVAKGNVSVFSSHGELYQNEVRKERRVLRASKRGKEARN